MKNEMQGVFDSQHISSSQEIFLGLIIGLILSFIIFIAEILYFRIKNKYKYL